MNIQKRISSNKNTGRNGWKPDMIVCHITEGSFAGAVEWLCSPASQASAHFVVARDGRITQLVELEDTAWANGTSSNASDSKYYGNSAMAAVRERKTNANYYTISIEHEGFNKDTQGALTPAQLDTTVELIRHIRAEVKRLYGVDIPVDRQHIVGHCDVAPKWKPNCPGIKYPFDEVIRRVNDSTSTTTATDTPTLRRGDAGQNVTRLQELLNAAGASPVLSTDGSFGPATETAVKAFQSLKAIIVDGVCGPNTWAALLALQTPVPNAVPAKTSAEITVDNLLADGVITEPSHWLGYLSGNTVTKPEWVKAIFDRYHEKLERALMD